MPTTKKRTQVTHTPQIEEALRVAAQVWPNENAAALLTHLATEGAKTLEATRHRASAERKRQVDAVARDFAGIYPPGYATISATSGPSDLSRRRDDHRVLLPRDAYHE